MRTQIPRILPGCIYCNFDHDPAIECRFKPESPRFHYPERSLHMEHKHEPVSDRTVYRLERGHHMRTEFCVCGASREVKRHTGQPGQGQPFVWTCREWIFPEDPPPAAESSGESFCNPLQNPSKLQYVAKHGAVLQGAARVATAKSHTFAKRIAKALNHLSECPAARSEGTTAPGDPRS